MYGNKPLKDDPLETRVFPYIMGKMLDFFSYKSSRFNFSKAKEATARIALFKELKIPCVYTMEASFCGATQGEMEGYHFTTDAFMRAGKTLFFALIVHQQVDI